MPLAGKILIITLATLETDDPYSKLSFALDLGVEFLPFTPGVAIALLVMAIFLTASALISGSEVAFFSLSPANINSQKKQKNKKAQAMLALLLTPEKLLATILIANNFVNIGIVMLSTYISDSLFDFSQTKFLGFLFQVLIVTFLLLLFGEIIPKVYANFAALPFALIMSLPLLLLSKIFNPISRVLISSTKIVNKRMGKKNYNISIDELSDVLDLTKDSSPPDEQKILQGIVNFGNIDTKAIMRSRVHVVAVDETMRYTDLLEKIVESGYSRIPVFRESFDHIKGILYIKDLLPHLERGDEFQWQRLIRSPYFVPETKKINDLLAEFQEKKIHMAIVIDEYGGASGIATLEDVLEEIVGEITDEFDEEEFVYEQQDPYNYIFEGKTLLNDFYKILEIDDSIFDEVKGESETLAGLVLEIRGEMPQVGVKTSYKNFTFKIKALEGRRIRLIQVTLHDK